jgi:hypothetical protein
VTQPGGSVLKAQRDGPDGPGGIWVAYDDFNWTFYRTANVSVDGGTGAPCTQPYIAQITEPSGGCGTLETIPLANSATDAGEPHAWNGTGAINGSETAPGCPVQTPGTYVWFDSSFHLGSSGPPHPFRWDLCNTTGFVPLALDGYAQVPIAVTVPFGGTEISATGFLT